ncbi:MAG: DUF5655 domain-containing protein [Armatimonadota bacterium]
MNAIRVSDSISLIFTKVLDQLSLGFVDEDEEIAEVTDRNYWEQKATKNTVAIADDILDLIKNNISPNFELKYNKFYIGLANEGQPNNFVKFKPQKKSMKLELRMPKSDEIEEQIDSTNIDMHGYNARWGVYVIKTNKDDIRKNEALIVDLLKMAYNNAQKI